MSIAQQITSARLLRNMTQGELARLASMPPSAISHYERGQREPSATALQKLSIALVVSADYLLGLRPEPWPPSEILVGVERLPFNKIALLQTMVSAMLGAEPAE